MRDIIYCADLDGSMHPASEGNPGAVAYVRANKASCLAEALLGLWSPANITQALHPNGVPFRKALKQISEQR